MAGASLPRFLFEKHAHRDLRRGSSSIDKESFKRETRYLKRGEIWCFTITGAGCATGTSTASVAAVHQPRLQAELLQPDRRKDIWIRAAKNIEAGEELTYDYYTDGEKVIQCRCRPGCTRKL
jgi:SET domain-containing protein